MRINLSNTATLFHADCRETLRTLPDNSVDSCVTDPPYHLTNNTGTRSPYPGQYTPIGDPKKPKGGFMGKQWDGGDIAQDASFWAEVFRVLKPGAHLAAFSASRTYHRMAVAIEDAGFEIRDSLMWVYGSGFPKSQNVSLALDKRVGAIGHLAKSFNMKGGGDRADEFTDNGRDFSIRHEPISDAAREWAGFGTALKPAFEPIVLARKPLSEATVAANVLRWRTGALNIDGCRVGFANAADEAESKNKNAHGDFESGPMTNAIYGKFTKDRDNYNPPGRWPANVVHDGSDEVVRLFPNAKGDRPHARGGKNPNPMDWGNERKDGHIVSGRVEQDGSAARFFYSAKASKQDRNGSKHPTVKPISLISWIARLITPPGGTILDPFAGSGTTGAAATQEGFSCLLCERESEYVADIRRRFVPARISLDAFRNELALLPQVHALQARLAARA